MRYKQTLIALLILVAVVLLTGCGGSTDAEAQAASEIPAVLDELDQVVAEAVIEPARWGELGFEIVGDPSASLRPSVTEVLIQEGDTVAAGDVLARLETVGLERAVAQAELSLHQAEVRLSQAQLRLAQLQEPPDEADVRQAEHAVAQAEATIKAAQLDLAAVVDSPVRNESLEDAQEVYEDLRHKVEARVEMYESGEEPDYWFVDQAQERMDDAKLDLDRIRQQGSAQMQDARNALQQAEQSYQEAQDALAELLEGADPLDVEAAQKEIAAAQLDVDSAALNLEEAQSDLEDAELVAPFSGAVVAVNVDPGDEIGGGEVAVVLATLDHLQAVTVDLTELDVARIREGQAATISVDALPEREFAGVVQEIALQSGDYRGDVVYAVTIELPDLADAPLRWGMTAVVQIEGD
jgi:HlyD family secretion protein